MCDVSRHHTPVLGSFEPTTSIKPAIYDLPTGRMDLRCGASANTGLDDDVSYRPAIVATCRRALDQRASMGT